MYVKDYFKLLLKTTHSPKIAMKKVSEQDTKFHMLYYFSFNFIFGVILCVMALLSPDSFSSEHIAISGVTESIMLILLGCPFMLLMFSMYMDFAQLQIFKIKGVTLDYFKVLLWVYHYTIYLFILTSAIGVLVVSFTFYGASVIAQGMFIYPFISFLALIFIGLTVSSTKSSWRSLVIFAVAPTMIYAVTYFIGF
jgi:hypothetical protein